MNQAGYAEQHQTVKADCCHCKGSGKCECLSCKNSFAQNNNFELKNLPDKTIVKCSICDGTGNYHYSIRKAIFVTPFGFYNALNDNLIPDMNADKS